GGRALLWFKPQPDVDLRELRLGVGEPVRLWAKQADGPEQQAGVIAKVERARLGVAVDADYAEFLDEGGVNLDREAPEITFDRGAAALARLRDAKADSRAGQWREFLYGEAKPQATRRGAAPALSPFDAGLNQSQLDAVQFALDAPQLALIHGPPGTGKTRTLVEIVRQCLRRSERLLLTAASNTAVDNLAERLIAAGVPVLRLGHPARVASSVADSTLDARLEQSPARKLSRRLMSEATELRRRVEKRRARGNLAGHEARELYAQARGLASEARAQLELAREQIFQEAKLVCATAAGADGGLLARLEFDRVILDEATQAADPIALIPLSLAPRAVLAGDPCQLSPTLLSSRAAAPGGLSTTLFERLAERDGSATVRLLDTQYRMHEHLMRFPSESMYRGQLKAAPEVARRVLRDFTGVIADPLRGGPLVFLDTAGKGYGEQRSEDQPSTSNPGQAERVAIEVRRILRRGLLPEQLALITPYDAQVRALRAHLRAEFDAGLEIGTVDGFQGREKEAIVVDLVRSNDDGQLGFLNDVRRMNVALTRAKRFLLVIGDSATLTHHPYYAGFMDAADAQGGSVSAWSDDGLSDFT
ncbi:MAG TPA: AAA domain-containing protein, partial [Polyangiales bacterium]|nr:AAA domain-containing protein [Polyangiales bacterium]